VQFSDYRCGYCKLAAPEVLSLIAENPDTRFVFKEYPIFKGVSDIAGRVAVTPMAKGKGLALYQNLMADKALDDAALDRHLRQLGLDPAAARRAAHAPDIEKHIADNHALGEALGVSGTPAFFVGDVMVPGADMDAVRVALAQLKARDIKPSVPPAIDKPAGA
jgi:protein-disulfide isomerase